MTQLGLKYEPPAGPRYFYGPEYSAAKDQPRWSRHCAAVLEVLSKGRHGHWYTYEELARFSGVPPGSVRTRVSNLRAQGVGIEVRTRADRFCEVRLA